MKSIIEQLEFNHHSVKPTDIMTNNEEYLLINKIGCYDIAYAQFDDDSGEFDGFYDFVGEGEPEPLEFYDAWAHLPCSIGFLDKIGD